MAVKRGNAPLLGFSERNRFTSLPAPNFTFAYAYRLPAAPLLQLHACQACSPTVMCLSPQFRSFGLVFVFLLWCNLCHSVTVTCTWFGVFFASFKQLCWAPWWLLPFPELSKVNQPIPLCLKNFLRYPLVRLSGNDLTDPVPTMELNEVWVFSMN